MKMKKIVKFFFQTFRKKVTIRISFFHLISSFSKKSLF